MLYDPACPFFQSTDLMKQPINSPSWVELGVLEQRKQ